MRRNSLSYPVLIDQFREIVIQTWLFDALPGIASQYSVIRQPGQLPLV
jgi:hypothetical protein